MPNAQPIFSINTGYNTFQPNSKQGSSLSLRRQSNPSSSKRVSFKFLNKVSSNHQSGNQVDGACPESKGSSDNEHMCQICRDQKRGQDMTLENVRNAADHMFMRTHGGDSTLLAFLRTSSADKNEGEKAQAVGLCDECSKLVSRELDLI
jgi:hypothetical protein